MAVLGRLLISSAERLDLPDLLSIDSYTAGDFKFLMRSLVGNTQPYILAGFDVIDPAAAIGTSSISITVANSIVYYPESTAGSFFYGLDPLNPLAQPLVPILIPNATNYVYITLTTLNTSSDTRAFWDPDLNAGAGGEFTQSVNTETALITQVGVSTTSYPANVVPICTVVMGANTITSIEDTRFLLFRLGTGGISPNVTNRFSFRALPDVSYQRNEPPITMTSALSPNAFQGGDKNIYTLKEWMDVVMTKIAELGSTTYWYQTSTPVLGQFLRIDGTNSPTAAINWNAQNLTNVNTLSAKTALLGGSTIPEPLRIFRDTNAGDSTNSVQLYLGNNGGSQGGVILTYTNGPAAANPSASLRFQPRDNANITDIDPAKIIFTKTIGANTASINLINTNANFVLNSDGTVDFTSALTTGNILSLINTDTGGHTYRLVSTGTGNSEGAGFFLLTDGSNRRITIDPNGQILAGNSALVEPLRLFRDNNAGDSTNEVKLYVGNKGDSQGGITFGYTNGPANQNPSAQIRFQPRNNANTTDTNVSSISFTKTIGANTGTISLVVVGNFLTLDNTNLSYGGLNVQLNSNGISAATSLIFNGVSDGLIRINGGTGGSGAEALFYGPSHATKPSYIDLRANGITVGQTFGFNGNWSLGKDVNSTVSFTGLQLQFNGSGTSGGGPESIIVNGIQNGNIRITGDINNSLGGSISVYGSSHATKPSYVEFHGNALLGQIIGASGNWSIGKDVNSTVSFTGLQLQFNGAGISGGAPESIITNGIANGDVRITGGTGAANGGQIILYGPTHLTKPNYVEFNAALTLLNSSLIQSTNSTTGTYHSITNTDTGGRAFELRSTGSGNSPEGAGSFILTDVNAGQARRMIIDPSGNMTLRGPSVIIDDPSVVATNPYLAQGSYSGTNRLLLVGDKIQLEASDGPILSRSGAFILRVEDQLQISGGGPILSNSAGTLVSDSSFQIPAAGAISIGPGGPTISNTAGSLNLNGNSQNVNLIGANIIVTGGVPLIFAGANQPYLQKATSGAFRILVVREIQLYDNTGPVIQSMIGPSIGILNTSSTESRPIVTSVDSNFNTGGSLPSAYVQLYGRVPCVYAGTYAPTGPDGSGWTATIANPTLSQCVVTITINSSIFNHAPMAWVTSNNDGDPGAAWSAEVGTATSVTLRATKIAGGNFASSDFVAFLLVSDRNG